MTKVTTKGRTVKVAALQLPLGAEDVETNVARVVKGIREAAAQGGQGAHQ